jgi:hypothetical protein
MSPIWDLQCKHPPWRVSDGPGDFVSGSAELASAAFGVARAARTVDWKSVVG